MKKIAFAVLVSLALAAGLRARPGDPWVLDLYWNGTYVGSYLTVEAVLNAEHELLFKSGPSPKDTFTIRVRGAR